MSQLIRSWAAFFIDISTNRSRGQASLLNSDPKIQTWWRTLSTCVLPSFVKFCSAVVEKMSKCLGLSEAQAAIFIDISAGKITLGRGREVLTFSGRRGLVGAGKLKCFNHSEARAAVFVEESGRKTNFLEDFEFLHHVKFRQILFSSCRGVVEMSRLIGGRGGHLCWKIGPKNANFAKDVQC